MLTLLAIAGSICLILVVLSYFFNISIMMFRTGSMSPTIDAGSVAFVREIPATDLQVGDVVTVDRGEGLLPVTHRVLEIQTVDEHTGIVTFTMQGDANDTPDPLPYTVDTAREVLFSVPGIASTLQWFSNPWVLGGLTISASSLVVWAFWPREEKSKKHAPVPGAHHAMLVPLLVALAPIGLAPSHMAGEPNIERIHGEVLQMRSITFPEAMNNMSPGDSATWIVDVWAEATEPGDIEVRLSADGVLSQEPDAMHVSVRSCPLPAQDHDSHGCISTNTTQLLSHNLIQLQQTASVAIDEFSTNLMRRYLITANLNAELSNNVQNLATTLQLTITGHGETYTLGPEKPDPLQTLPETGKAGLPGAFLASILLVLAGITASVRSRRSQHE